MAPYPCRLKSGHFPCYLNRTYHELTTTPSYPLDTATVMFEPQPVPKSPLLAFLLSLALPGAGQPYFGKTSRCLWPSAIFLPALCLTVYFTLQPGRPHGNVVSLL